MEADFPAWCRMTGNELVSWTKVGRLRSFLVCKGALAERVQREPAPTRPSYTPSIRIVPVAIPPTLPAPAPAPPETTGPF